ncbi:hypothetical protein TTHERM_000630536 (macronuclear) [Tetrahymena thermophila SB210]|uniref:Uncharacterized protein n=1 Tax=Tetrahymena thermophila (strain SB210) TaxID=312017 RepID=W7XEZ5_TETTS|nr:hypothetical protein TTHERM_000630536 [Tetrahymena thermophila SB210]EWS72561.1 hypothetical protein TTHERM_000630536 [Tetrahymena thermophila SB210]|eukprot:XP_012654844.1 hypothetical protein TTHERM_000630536 [Tetrahymena thermophila SB210]
MFSEPEIWYKRAIKIKSRAKASNQCVIESTAKDISDWIPYLTIILQPAIQKKSKPMKAIR